MTVWPHLRHHMSCHPNATVSDGKRTQTYEEWLLDIERFAHKLRPHSCAAILCPSPWHTATAYLACLASGTTALPLPADHPIIARDHLHLVQPSAILTEDDGILTIHPHQSKPSSLPAIHDDPALILFTSGTTAAPKGVCLSETNLMTALSDFRGLLPFTPEDRLFLSSPLCDADSLISLLLPALEHGTSLYFSSTFLHPTRFFSLLEREHITICYGTPTQWAARLRFMSRQLPLRTLLIGGECLTPPLADAIAAAFPQAKRLVGYGATETSGWIALSEAQDGPSFSTVLRPLPSVRITRSNDSLRIGGARVMMGYLERAATISSVQAVWESGDLATITEDGLLSLHGRAAASRDPESVQDDTFAIESALSRDPRVWEVQYRPGISPDGKDAVLQLVGAFVHPDELRAVWQRYLPDRVLPKQIEIVDALPQTPNGKHLRRSYAT